MQYITRQGVLLTNHIIIILKCQNRLRKKFTLQKSIARYKGSFDKWCGKTCGKIKTAIKITVCRKSMFFQIKCLFSTPIPFRTLCWLCFVQSLVCPYFGILAENPFPWERGYITGATAPRPCRGLRPCDPIFI